MRRGFTILAVGTAGLLSFALYAALVIAPTEQTMGNVQRIFYYHVPSAWTAFLLFFLNFAASVQFLVRRTSLGPRIANGIATAVALAVAIACFFVRLPSGIEPSSVATTAIVVAAIYLLIGRYFSRNGLDVFAIATAEVGVVFCTVVLITGPIWARPVWGIWWAWDLRLTLTLVLWLIYVSYLVLRRFSTSSQTPLLAAVLAVFGALDVPLVYFSIWFFRTQHPAPVIGGGGSLDPRMGLVLLYNWIAFLSLAWLVCWTRYRLEVAQRTVHEAEAMQSLTEGAR